MWGNTVARADTSVCCMPTAAFFNHVVNAIFVVGAGSIPEAPFGGQRITHKGRKPCPI
jgi:hypothetical protein